jgi:hypothetical protein
MTVIRGDSEVVNVYLSVAGNIRIERGHMSVVILPADLPDLIDALQKVLETLPSVSK